ncbi:hypothetical protein ES703_51410 [subsurface metagenome]
MGGKEGELTKWKPKYIRGRKKKKKATGKPIKE